MPFSICLKGIASEQTKSEYPDSPLAALVALDMSGHVISTFCLDSPCPRGPTIGDANAAGSGKIETGIAKEIETGIVIPGAVGQATIVKVHADERALRVHGDLAAQEEVC